MFKKMVAGLLAITLCFGLAACGETDEGETTEANINSETTDEPYVPFPPNDEDGGDVKSTDSGSSSGSGNSSNDGDSGEAPTSNTVRVTLTEGMTLVKMSWVLEEKGVCSSKEFIDASQNVDFSKYPLVAAAMKAPNVCLKLEGYLKPDTYEFYKNESPEQVLDKLVSAMESSITSQMRSRAAQLGYSMHEILAMASIVEKEGQTKDQRENVASVLHNRLKTGMQLQCDATINYVEYVIGTEEVYNKNDPAQYQKYDYYRRYYSTKRCAGLPAGPICNPSMESINAALYPADTNYLYFAIKNGQALYAADYDTHLANCDKLGITY